ncbi:hypothetical protein [Mycoplasma phocoenae]|uniref:Uncharacterized protein n=1 Tax=Mycoplasma phocoenae TaxID=754517 RepID=A0A858U2Y9_9MOLU|nr:hypothetical protein [Mycoplasma phocoenae]QJG66840.1 hypothetical protein HGG69_00645 [Mycoplasma phocoenae]
MAIILIVGYLLLILYNLFYANKQTKIPLIKLLIIGISVQFAWEFALLINNIRPWNSSSIHTLAINSLIETNLGLPYIYLIFLRVEKNITIKQWFNTNNRKNTQK